jgi:hypothetical protein
LRGHPIWPPLASLYAQQMLYPVLFQISALNWWPPFPLITQPRSQAWERGC